MNTRQWTMQTHDCKHGGRPAQAERNANKWRRKGYLVGGTITPLADFHIAEHYAVRRASRTGSYGGDMTHAGGYVDRLALHRRWLANEDDFAAVVLAHRLFRYVRATITNEILAQQARKQKDQRKKDNVKVLKKAGAENLLEASHKYDWLELGRMKVRAPLPGEGAQDAVLLHSTNGDDYAIINDGGGKFAIRYSMVDGLQAALSALVPALVRESTSDLWRRQGDIYLHPICYEPTGVEQGETIPGIYIDPRVPVPSRHRIEGKKWWDESTGVTVVQGTLHAPDHTDIVLDTPHIVVVVRGSGD